MAADVFADLEPDDQQYIIQSLSHKEASTIIDNLMSDDAADLLEDMLEEMPAELRDKTARETWERILPDILREETTCNLDRDNVIMYCNAWSETMEAQRRLKRNKTDDDYQELWRRRLKDARAECRRYGRLIGMDPSSRLQRASTKVDAEDEKITAMFGGI